MTARNDFVIWWYDDPRRIEILAPATSVPVQDIHDTLIVAQDSIEGSEFPDLIASEGKAAGITGVVSTLQNAQIFFAPRNIKLQLGTVITADTTGKILNDSAAAFSTNLVTRGDIALNATDGSHATVLTVVGENQLLLSGLEGGSDNQWAFGDSYEIFGYVECRITNGDLIAVDDLGASITPYLTSFGVTGPIIELATSPAAVPFQPDTVVDGTNTANDAFRVLLATLGSKVSGVTTSQEKFRNPADTKDRVTVNLDVDGNRTSVVLDMSD